MTITLDHTIVTAADNDEAARFFDSVMAWPAPARARRRGISYRSG